MDLGKLIQLLEAAREGSEYLDYVIQRQFSFAKPVPTYSQSLDAALLLLPEGWSIHRLGQRHDCKGKFTGWIAEIYRAGDAVIAFPADSQGATAPIALCIAALRVVQNLSADAAEDGQTMLKRQSVRR